MNSLVRENYIVYITTNLINGKKYIGSNSTDNPNYKGGGIGITKAIKKYRRCISNCLLGISQSGVGFKWKYYE